MATEFDSSFRSGGSGHYPDPTPVWIWIVVASLTMAAAYASYKAITASRLLQEVVHAREALAKDKDRLEANISDMQRQVEQATKAKDDTETALKQSRADTQAASAQITDLQRQIDELQTKLTSLEGSTAAASESAKQAAAEKAQLENEVQSLKTRTNELQHQLDAALADVARARQGGGVQSPSPAPPLP